MTTIRQYGLIFGLFLGASALIARSAYASEPECFHTAAEAAVRSGAPDVRGFRLESVEQDAFADLRWARVRSCSSPERPAQLVPLAVGTAVARRLEQAGVAPAGTFGSAVQRSASAPVMQAGRHVTLVIHDETMRLEVGAVALGNGLVGERVRVRLEQMAAGGEERFAEGIVRGAGLVEAQR